MNKQEDACFMCKEVPIEYIRRGRKQKQAAKY
jgi:hypothetical protein